MMSRASAGTFAAFFPNAPSVLQQKRKRASHGKDVAKCRAESPSADGNDAKALEDGPKAHDGF